MNWSHIKRLSIVMRWLEDALADIDAALEPQPARARLLTTYNDDIDEAIKPIATAMLTEIRDAVRRMKDAYDLPSSAISNRRRITAKLSLLAVDLTECRSQHLRGYGEVPRDEQEPLDRRVAHLEDLVNGLNHILASGEPPTHS